MTFAEFEGALFPPLRACDVTDATTPEQWRQIAKAEVRRAMQYDTTAEDRARTWARQRAAIRHAIGLAEYDSWEAHGSFVKRVPARPASQNREG